MSDGQEVVAHLSIALSRYIKELARDGRRVPSELEAALDFCTDLVRMRPDATPLGDLAGSGDASPMTTVLTKREAAHELRCSVRTVERLIASGDLPSVNVAGGVRVRRGDRDVFVAGLGPRSFRDDVTTKESA